MPHITAKFNNSGPIVEVFIGVSAPKRRALSVSGLPAPPRLALNFIIDTGADTSMIADQHMRSLGISPRGSRAILTSTSDAQPTTCETYDVELSLRTYGDDAFVVPALEILGRPLFNLSIDGMLGMDVLRRMVLTIDGPGQRLRIDY